MNSRTQRAFTLIELLVVVAIIALLISILLPSLQAAKDRGKAVKCASNERQLGLGLTYYVHEYGFYPSEHYQPSGGGDWMTAWVPRIRAYADYQDDIFWCPATPSEFRWGPSPQDEWSGTLPAVAYGYRPGEKPITAPGGQPFFSYGHNGSGTRLFTPKCYGMGMHTRDSDDGEVNAGRREVAERDILRPAEMIAIADSRGDAESDTEISAQVRRWEQHPGTRHFGGSEVLFADGHVVWMRLSDQLVCKLDGNGRQIVAEFDGAIIRRWMNDFLPHRNVW